MTLYEVGFLKVRLPPKFPTTDFNRVEILYACLESAGNFFENFLAIPPLTYWQFTIIDFSQLAYALNVLQRLSLFEDPSWDLRYVSEKLNFLHILDRTCNQMEVASRYRVMEPANGSEQVTIFTRTLAKLRKLGAMFEAQLAPSQVVPGETGTLDPATGDGMPMESLVGFWEQDWFDIMAGDWGGL